MNFLQEHCRFLLLRWLVLLTRDSKITMEIVQNIANSINPMIKLTIETTCHFKDKKLPVLDVTVEGLVLQLPTNYVGCIFIFSGFSLNVLHEFGNVGFDVGVINHSFRLILPLLSLLWLSLHFHLSALFQYFCHYKSLSAFDI